MLQNLIAILTAITLRDAAVWSWRKWRRSKKTAENLAGMRRFLDEHPECSLSAQDAAVAKVDPLWRPAR